MSDQEIKCLKNEPSKLFNNPIRYPLIKDIRYMVDYINKSKNLIKNLST